MKIVRFILLFLFCLFGSVWVYGQGNFQMVNLTTEKTQKFAFGNKVMFQLNAKDSAVLDKKMKGVINEETRVYQMV